MPKATRASTRKVRRRVSGRVPGVSYPSTAKSAAHSRVAGWKHGGYAQVVSPLEARAASMDNRFGDGASEVVRAYAGALNDGDLDGVSQINGVAMAETELLRRRIVDSVQEKGVVIDEEMVGSEGQHVGTRTKVHPGLEPLRWMNEQLGHTAADTQLSRKSRGEGAVNEALARRLARDSMLRSHSKDSMAAPPILTTAVK